MLKIAVAQPLLGHRAQIFIGHIAARKALVVGGEDERNSRLAVKRQRMIAAFHPEYHRVAGQIDLNRDAPFRHGFQKRGGIGLISDINAVPDPAGPRDHHRLLDMKRQIARRHQPQRDLSRME